MAYANPDGSGGRPRANKNAAKNGTKLTVRLSKPQTTVDRLLLAFPPHREAPLTLLFGDFIHPPGKVDIYWPLESHSTHFLQLTLCAPFSRTHNVPSIRHSGRCSQLGHAHHCHSFLPRRPQPNGLPERPSPAYAEGHRPSADPRFVRACHCEPYPLRHREALGSHASPGAGRPVDAAA